MDYCARESTINTCQGEEAVARDASIKMNIQETRKILMEMGCVLDEFAAIVNGQKREDKTPRDACSLWDEASMLTALAYENLQKILEIKNSIY